MPMHVKGVERTYTHILAHNFLNTSMDFQSEKSFGKLRLRAFQPYHQMLSMSEVLKVILTFDTSDMLQHT